MFQHVHHIAKGDWSVSSPGLWVGHQHKVSTYDDLKTQQSTFLQKVPLKGDDMICTVTDVFSSCSLPRSGEKLQFFSYCSLEID